jgi:FG-GAP-like repeat/ASPIC and UnbV/SprB repeat/Secretion system C-terminal sorting domain
MNQSIGGILVLMLLQTSTALGQGFIEVAEQNGINMRNTGNSILGVGMSFYDFDKDGWDDLTYCSSNDSLVMYRNLEGLGFERMEIFPFTHDSKMAAWVDYDNDGDADLLWTKRSGSTRLFRNDGNWQFVDVTANLGLTQNGGTHCYGSAWVDYDRDGWLDVFIATLSTLGNSRNFLCHNNQDGTFTEVSDQAGIADLASLTFQGVWQDFNNDLWPDLYVINDNNQSNRLYINNQDGTFSDITVSAGVATNAQSMNAGVNDYDNDGDWDIYVTDALSPNFLWTNNGNLTFTNASASANLTVGSFCWGAAWLDYDHDTWDDVYVTTASNGFNQDFFYRNNGDGTFTNPGIAAIDSSHLFTYAPGRGDFNNDGFWDISVTCTGDTSYLLYQGLPNENQWLKLTLQGTHSNRDAIGTQIDYYIEGQHRVKYTRCGEGYLTQNSAAQILSMGAAFTIDSLVVTWPRGLVEKYYDIASNQTIALVEGDGTSVAIQASDTLYCGQPITLYAGDYASYVWSDNSTNDSLVVEEAGMYEVMVVDTNGYSFDASIEILNGAEIIYSLNLTQPSCYAQNTGIAEVLVFEGTEILWEDGGTDFIRPDLGIGWNSFTLTQPGFCTYHDSLEVLSAPVVSVTSDYNSLLCAYDADGFINLDFDFVPDNVEWDDGVFGASRNNLSAGFYAYTVHYDMICSVSGFVNIIAPPVLTAQAQTTAISCTGGNDGSAIVLIQGGTPGYEISTGGVDLSALADGVYPYQVTDTNGCVFSSNIVIDDPQPLELTLISLTNAVDGNNGSIQVEITGGTAPYDYAWSNSGTTAFVDGLGQGIYQLNVLDNNLCPLDTSFSILDVSHNELQEGFMAIYPVPVSDRMNVRTYSNKPIEMRMFNALGELVHSENLVGQLTYSINCVNLAPGCYVLVIAQNGFNRHLKITKE